MLTKHHRGKELLGLTLMGQVRIHSYKFYFPFLVIVKIYCLGSEKALLCGGWVTTSIPDSLPKQGFIKGEYFKSCEVMNKGQDWDKENTIDMTRHRAFFSMTATDKGIYAFGGMALEFRHNQT